MTDRTWRCPCNGCAKARRQTLLEIKDLIDKNLNDAPYAMHLVYSLIIEETRTKKKDQDKKDAKTNNNNN